MFCLFRVPILDFAPVQNLPEGGEVGSPTVLVIQVVSMLPDVKGEDGLEAVGHRVVCISELGNGELAFVVGLQPDPAGTEEGCALGFELRLEGVHATPLFFDLGFEMPDQVGHDGGRAGRNYRRGCFELTKVQFVIENLAGIIEHPAHRSLHNLFQSLPFKLRTGNQLVQVIYVGLKVFAVVEFQSLL